MLVQIPCWCFIAPEAIYMLADGLEALQKSANSRTVTREYVDDSCKAKLLLSSDGLTSFQSQEWRTMVTDCNNRYCNAEKLADLIAGQKVVMW